MHAEQLFQFDLQASEVEQGRAGKCVHKKIKVASILVGAMERRPEHARVLSRVTIHPLANGLPFECKSYGRFHVVDHKGNATSHRTFFGARASKQVSIVGRSG